MLASLEDNDTGTCGPLFILDGKTSLRLLAQEQGNVLKESGVSFQNDTSDDAPIGRPTHH